MGGASGSEGLGLKVKVPFTSGSPEEFRTVPLDLISGVKGMVSLSVVLIVLPPGLDSVLLLKTLR